MLRHQYLLHCEYTNISIKCGHSQKEKITTEAMSIIKSYPSVLLFFYNNYTLGSCKNDWDNCLGLPHTGQKNDTLYLSFSFLTAFPPTVYACHTTPRFLNTNHKYNKND